MIAFPPPMKSTRRFFCGLHSENPVGFRREHSIKGGSLPQTEPLELVTVKLVYTESPGIFQMRFSSVLNCKLQPWASNCGHQLPVICGSVYAPISRLQQFASWPWNSDGSFLFPWVVDFLWNGESWLQKFYLLEQKPEIVVTNFKTNLLNNNKNTCF